MTTVLETSSGKSTSSSAAWKKKRDHRGITLPSGAVVDIRLPDLAQLAKAGSIPTELLDAAQTLQQRVIAGGTGTGSVQVLDALTNQAGFSEYIIPIMVINPKITGEDVKELPAEDIAMLGEFANRERDLDAVGHHLAGMELLAEWRRFRWGEDAP